MSLPAYAMNQPSFPELYERHLVGPLFSPFAEYTLKKLDLASGDTVLDIACGTGIVGRAAKQRVGAGGKVVGVDISPDMLAVARAVAPDIDFREGSALDLPLGEGEEFDVVICQQGLQFFPDKPAAARQMFRALAKNGRLAVSAWRVLEENSLFHDLHRAAEPRLGAFLDTRHSFGDAEALKSTLQQAGFAEVHVQIVTLQIHLPEPLVLLRLNTMALIGMSGAAKDLSEQERDSLIHSLMTDGEPALKPYRAESGLTFQMATNLATATRSP